MTDSPSPPPEAALPSVRGTALLLAGLAATSLFSEGDTASALARSYAIGVGLTLVLSALADYRGGLRSLVRADLMALGSLYFLTLFEFLFPQTAFDLLLGRDQVAPALLGCLYGFGGLAVGRHLAPRPPDTLSRVLVREFPPATMLVLFTIGLVGGYFYMLLAVDFDLQRLFDGFLGPRFSVPWGRGKFGDWKALVGELGMVLYLVPPIAGIVLARRQDFSLGQKLYVSAGFLFTLFYGFTSGTRNIFACYLATFLVAYAFTTEPRRKRELIVVSAVCAALMLAATVVMLEFRNIGVRRYLQGYKEFKEQRAQQEFFVDHNLYVIAELIEVFPAKHDYLGWEIPYLAAVRPIPRALWPGKPEGMSLSIEDAVGVRGLTLASSFVGEAYMSGGFFGIALAGLVLGGIAGWWNRLGRPDNSPFGHLVFASGFFAAVISMRSLFVFTTAILPTIAALVLGNWFLSRHPMRPLSDDDAAS